MAPFQFRLEHVARLRVVERDLRRGRLADASRRMEQLDDELHQVQQQLSELRHAARHAAPCGQVDADWLRRTSEYAWQLRSRLRELDADRQAARRQVEQYRAELVEAEQHVKTLEKLRDRQRLAHGRQLARCETLEHDELARRPAGECESPGMPAKGIGGCS